MLLFTHSFLYKAVTIFAALYMIYLLVHRSTASNKIFYLLIITLLSFLIKLPYFFLGGLNPDESEWITIIKIWHVNFNPYINSDPHTTGIFGLLPLYLFDKLIPLNYATLRILETVFDLFTIYLTYKILLSHHRQNKNLLFISLAVMFCLLNANIEADFVAYNTEHLCILVFTIILYLLNKTSIIYKYGVDNEKKRQTNLQLLIAGILIGSSLFIKLQNIPVIFIVFCFASFHFLKTRNYKDLALLIFSCLLPVVITLLFLYFNGALKDFYVRYLLTNFDYTSKGLNFDFVDTKLYGPLRFKPQRLYPFALVTFLSFLLVITNINKLKKIRLNQNIYFFLLVLICAIYEIVQPRNYFQHYFLLLYQPLIPLFICFRNFQVKKTIIAVILVSQFLFYWVFRVKDRSLYFYDYASEKLVYDKITSDIKSKIELYNCDPKNILVWGWNSPYYVYGKFIPVTRDFVNVHLFVHEGFLEKYYLNSFISDIQKNKHKRILVVDDLEQRKRWKKYNFPEFINHYDLSKNFRSITKIEHNDQYDTYVIELF